MEKVLRLYTYVDGTNDTPFPNADSQIVLGDFTYNAVRMGGAPSITATVSHELCLDDLWNDKVYAEFNGERYFVKTIPSSSKSNDDTRYEHELELLGERDVLNHVYFIDAVQSDSSVDVYKSNSTSIIFFGDVNEFAQRTNAAISYSGLDYTVVVDEGISSEDKQVSFEDKYILEALQEFFNVFEIPYYFVGKTIHIGYTENAIPNVMKYGSTEALLSIEKQNANYAVINKITGVGSTDNIPYYYPNESDDRDAIEAAGKKWITPTQNLMPPIYRESDGANRFYEAINNTYPTPEGGYYEFENEYSTRKKLEGKTEFPDIKPTITGITNAGGYRIDSFIGFAYDADDNDEVDEEGNYLHPYFFAKLRKTDGQNGFNLFDQAIEDQTMQISMTSGFCGGCTFEIAVGNDTQKNLVQVNDDGNLLRDEKGNVLCGREDLQQPQEPQARQNDTYNYSVWIALRKDDSTYPVLMPNNRYYGYKPTTDDTFVILGINLPEGYITAAEQRLEDSLIKYMWENNREKFTFTVKFSRIYFEENPEVLALLNENARIVIEYNNKEHTLYVDNFTYKMESKYPLPEIEVDLVDTITVGQNSLQTALDSVKQDILSSVGHTDFLKQGLKYFIRKDINDEAKGVVTFRRGAVFGNNGFAGGLSGFGGRIDNAGNGELDSLTLRRFLEVPELRYNRVEVSVGDKWGSPGAGIIEEVEIDVDSDGTELKTGTITLHLEDGEIGAVAVDDICMGIFHDWETPTYNATENYDDGKGNRRFAGFYTVYFRITEITETGSNSKFRYMLRSASASWPYLFHPCSAMHFVCYGNFTNADRQKSNYSTLTYWRFLQNVSDWEFVADNIAAQFGDLSNLSIFGLMMDGYSAYLNNIYMTGTIEQIDNDPLRMEIDTQGDNYLAYGEMMTVTCKVYKGWRDVTDTVVSWAVTRDSGDAEADAEWAAQQKVVDFDGTIEIAYTATEDDLGDNPYSSSTLFTFSAAIADGTNVQYQLVV